MDEHFGADSSDQADNIPDSQPLLSFFITHFILQAVSIASLKGWAVAVFSCPLFGFPLYYCCHVLLTGF